LACLDLFSLWELNKYACRNKKNLQKRKFYAKWRKKSRIEEGKHALKHRWRNRNKRVCFRFVHKKYSARSTVISDLMVKFNSLLNQWVKQHIIGNKIYTERGSLPGLIVQRKDSQVLISARKIWLHAVFKSCRIG